jgi:hypothetical protein
MSVPPFRSSALALRLRDGFQGVQARLASASLARSYAGASLGRRTDGWIVALDAHGYRAESFKRSS